MKRKRLLIAAYLIFTIPGCAYSSYNRVTFWAGFESSYIPIKVGVHLQLEDQVQHPDKEVRRMEALAKFKAWQKGQENE